MEGVQGVREKLLDDAECPGKSSTFYPARSTLAFLVICKHQELSEFTREYKPKLNLRYKATQDYFGSL